MNAFVTAPVITAPTLGQIFLSELVGTAVLILLGGGVVAGVVLPKTKSHAAGWVAITFGWGFAVFSAVYVAYRSGAHLNPAVTFGILFSGADEYAKGVPINIITTMIYIIADLLGAFLGAILVFLSYKKHFDEDAPAEDKLGVFSTGPAIRSYGWNLFTEAIATFVMVLVILEFGHSPGELGPLAVALLVVGVGLSLGGPTGYAINPARDLGPRIAHAILPIRGKGSSDWAYAWVPVVGPLIGGTAAGLFAMVF
ncbi:MIP/aquaporin family protein [Dermatophilus congolensis]|uniref:MIP/aquaporin family protein n=1 Tax=Dermatophilus congolensis TaxID=1863 RepID=UPI001AAF54B7|nr:MIP/aquaporin family protein [Dermatophilus congolensis]MBO3142178.1 aquaporin family protein [Dermatophilus congolensis]MBO3151170.1 aquaporin family protein [Dermatophilus congolensis]MBO3161829.1 aquaporin family protein [Dermatophilus congolensis]MBO3162453.1 aquaporin family protein [Dermatophilus congolensis]MBO3176010.1 aquaporin family protein [Dermatophilus congolensis]